MHQLSDLWNFIATNLYQWLKDLGSVIGGVLALIAALIVAIVAYRIGQRQARATKAASDAQLKAGADRDRLQAQGIALGVYPELLTVEETHKRATIMVDREWRKRPPFSLATSSRGNSANAAFIREAHISLPPILDRRFHHLYLLGDPGHSLQQLVSLILQYDSMLDTLARNVEQGVMHTALATHAPSFSDHLRHIGRLIDTCRLKLRPLCDETASANAPKQ